MLNRNEAADPLMCAEQLLAAIDAIVKQCLVDRHPEPAPGEKVFASDEPCELCELCAERLADAVAIRDLVQEIRDLRTRLQ